MIIKIKTLLKKYEMFIKYIMVAGISFLIDIVLFTIFNKIFNFSFKIILATILARIVSSFVNYLLNREKVFKSEENKLQTAIKYYALVIIQMFVSAFLVNNLYNIIKIDVSFIKIPVEFFLFICNYLIQKTLIFKKDTNGKYQNYFQLFLLTILSFLSFYKHIEIILNNEYFLSYINSLEIIKNIVTDYKFLYLLYFILFISLFFFYKKLYKNIKLDKKYNIFIVIMSFILVLGYSYELKSTGELFWGSILNLFISSIKIIGYYYFFKTLIFYFIKFIQKKNICKNKLVLKFSEHPYLYSFIFLSICYGIFLILYYPGIINYDNANQIKEMMGLHTRYLDAINPISDSTLTNFNPIVHTFLLGGLFKLGYVIGNVNFGLFIYTLIQLFIVISIYSYAISYCVKQKINPLYSFIILIILGLIPTFGYYSVTAVKDTLYSSFLLLFCVIIYDIVKKDYLKNSDYLKLFIISMLICLFRNNGLLIILFTIPFLLFKKNKLPIISILVLIFISYTSFNNVLLPSLGVSGTSIREVLSIPFQQTARVVKLKGDEISEHDKQIINKILDYDTLASLYNEDLSDPVKNRYNKDAKSEDLVEYFGVWFNGLVKYPMIYVDATINNITGYFYPFEHSWKVYFKLNEKLPEAGFDYHFNNLDMGRKIMFNYELIVEYSPIGLILNVGVITWLSILVFMMLCNKNKNYIFMIPSMLSILFCIFSPANTYFRYIYPSLLILVCLFPLIKVNLEEKE